MSILSTTNTDTFEPLRRSTHLGHVPKPPPPLALVYVAQRCVGRGCRLLSVPPGGVGTAINRPPDPPFGRCVLRRKGELAAAAAAALDAAVVERIGTAVLRRRPLLLLLINIVLLLLCRLLLLERWLLHQPATRWRKPPILPPRPPQRCFTCPLCCCARSPLPKPSASAAYTTTDGESMGVIVQ